MVFNPKATPEQRQKAVHQLIAALNADTKPIICGPWRSEVGFESLYWLPFLRHLADKVKDFDKRAAVVTRGGLAPLYNKVAHQGYDLFALRSVTEVRRENLHDAKVRQGGKTIKQLIVTPWDEQVLADAASQLKVGTLYHTVHPAWMYWALEPFWAESRGLTYLTDLTHYVPLTKPTLPDMPALPPKFVAVKFYARATFPYPNPDVSAWIEQTSSILSAQCPVVVLNSDPEYDDHLTIPIKGPNVFVLPQLPPEQNLLIQAAVLSKATAFVGTYGGVAQLALRLGIPSCSVWLEWGGTAHAHLSLSSWLGKSMNVPFLAGSIADMAFYKQVVNPPIQVVQAVQEVAA